LEHRVAIPCLGKRPPLPIELSDHGPARPPSLIALRAISTSCTGTSSCPETIAAFCKPIFFLWFSSAERGWASMSLCFASCVDTSSCPETIAWLWRSLITHFFLVILLLPVHLSSHSFMFLLSIIIRPCCDADT
jgi:hypothetical protein